MSAYSVISEISVTLRDNIHDSLDSAPDVDFGLGDNPGADIPLAAPSDDDTLSATLYLFHVEADQHLPNQRPLPRRGAPDELLRPPLPLKLRYLFTPRAGDETGNQLMLGRVIQHFHDNPFLGVVGGEPLGDSRGGASTELRVRLDMPSIEQLSQIWNAFSQPMRLSIALLVEIVAVDSGQMPVQAPRVRDAHTVVGIKESA